ncbi:469_t:CDS:2, partial [Gigaspora rosea]
GIYNDNPIIQNSLAEEPFIPAPCSTYDCNQYIHNDDTAGNTGVVKTYNAQFAKEDLKFSTMPNDG